MGEKRVYGVTRRGCQDALDWRFPESSGSVRGGEPASAAMTALG